LIAVVNYYYMKLFIVYEGASTLLVLQLIHTTREIYGSSRAEAWRATEVVWTKIYEPDESPDEHKPREHEHEHE
jgi:hypothetical protein